MKISDKILMLMTDQYLVIAKLKILALFSTKTFPNVRDSRKKHRHKLFTILGRARPAPNTTSSSRGILSRKG